MHTDKSKVALERVLKARAELILTRTFYGVLVGQVTPQMSNKVPTAATNGKVHYWNPDFINELSQDEVLGTQAHESEHDARRHGTRRGGRDQEKWNKACDYAINPDLVDQGFKLPEGALIDRKYKGMSAEDIYRSREIDEALERQKQEEQEQAEDESEPEEGEGEPSDNSEGEDHGDETEVDAEESEEGGDDEGDEGDEGETGEADETGNESEGEGSGEADGEPEGDGAGEGSTEAEGEASGDASGDANGKGGDADAEGESDEPTSCGDPGRCGEVLDSAETVAEIAE